jgi:hypothetical protein
VLMEGGHAQRLREPLRWSRREVVVAAIAAALLTLTVALGLYAYFDGRTSEGPCVKVTVPSTMGGSDLAACGAKAVDWCRTPLEAAGRVPDVAQDIRAECRRAGLP